MKLLILMRHGKARDDSPSGKDFDRPLTAKGEAQAESCARGLLERKFVPETIISSGAVRALATARKAAEVLGKLEKLKADSDLYGAGPKEIADIVSRIGDEYGSAMLVGHNPSLEAFAASISGDPISLGKGEAIAFPLALESWAEFASLKEASKGYLIKP